MSHTSPVKVVRHDITDSVQTRSSSGVVTIVQSDNTRADQTTEKQDETILNIDNETFHTATPFSFTNDNFDDDTNYRFTASQPFEAQGSRTVVKKATASRKGMLKEGQLPDNDDAIVSDNVTSAATVESGSASTSYTELAALMKSVSNELGQMSVTDASKQEKQKKKKQKKG